MATGEDAPRSSPTPHPASTLWPRGAPSPPRPRPRRAEAPPPSPPTDDGSTRHSRGGETVLTGQASACGQARLRAGPMARGAERGSAEEHIAPRRGEQSPPPGPGQMLPPARASGPHAPGLSGPARSDGGGVPVESLSSSLQPPPPPVLPSGLEPHVVGAQGPKASATPSASLLASKDVARPRDSSRAHGPGPWGHSATESHAARATCVGSEGLLAAALSPRAVSSPGTPSSAWPPRFQKGRWSRTVCAQAGVRRGPDGRRTQGPEPCWTGRASDPRLLLTATRSPLVPGDAPGGRESPSAATWPVPGPAVAPILQARRDTGPGLLARPSPPT